MRALTQAKRFFEMRSDWLGEGGKAVPREQAQARADVCLRCPLNHGPTIFLKRAVANLVKWQIALKNEMNLKVDNEDLLHTCQGCGCVLTLKVWVPIQFIKDTTDITKLHENCWITKEL